MYSFSPFFFFGLSRFPGVNSRILCAETKYHCDDREKKNIWTKKIWYGFLGEGGQEGEGGWKLGCTYSRCPNTDLLYLFLCQINPFQEKWKYLLPYNSNPLHQVTCSVWGHVSIDDHSGMWHRHNRIMLQCHYWESSVKDVKNNS